MSDLIAAEFLKLRTTRSFWFVAVLALALTVLFTVAQLAFETISTEDDARSLLSNVGVVGLLMLVLGVVSSAGEYRHGTITSTFLVAPDRRRVLFAKSLAHGLMGITVAVASAALILAISVPWLSADGDSLGSLGISASELAGIFAGAAAYAAISAMLGVGVGALLTNQVAAIVTILIVLFVVDPTLAALIDGYGKFSLSGVSAALTGGDSDDAGFDVFAPAIAGLLYLAYAAAITGITAAVAQQRDVS
jgi:ABC-2 type transport system permease protein